MKQERVKIKDLIKVLKEKLENLKIVKVCLAKFLF